MARIGGGTTAAPKPKPVVTKKYRPTGGSYVGLDVGTQTIKIVEVSGSGSNLKVTALALENTPPGTIQQGVIQDPKTLGAVIKSALTKNGVRSRKCVSSVGGSAGMVVRVIEVPKMTPSELGDTMKWQIEQYIPFPAADVEMSYQKIDDPATDNDPAAINMEVLLAVAQRDMLRAHTEMLSVAGLTPVAIDVEPLAVGRSLVNLSREGFSKKNVVVVNLGASLTDVGIFKNGVLRFPRTIPLGGDNITRAIADRMGLSMDAAEDEKRATAAILMDLVQSGEVDLFPSGAPGEDNGVQSPWDVDLSAPLPPPMFGDAAPAASVVEPGPFNEPNPFDDPFGASASTEPAPPEPADDPQTARQKEVFNAILPILGEFVMELRRSIDYFRSKYPMETVDQILLCGGSASLRNLDQYVQNELGVPAIVSNPFAGVNVVSKQHSTTRLVEIAPAFAVAMGLAARDAVIGS